jgi:hypothetical protein
MHFHPQLWYNFITFGHTGSEDTQDTIINFKVENGKYFYLVYD